GPVQPERQIAIYTTDITLPEGKLIGTTGLAYVEGGDIAALENASPQPMWSRVYKGYAGWERKQLNREINQDRWIVIDYNEKLLLETPADKIWGDAQAAATADKAPEEPQKRQQKM
ncbi:MAG TPA: YqgE/AlgH family protein, partial [Alphaproteobacteria bacterium]|nr:YqgE/AlgH family protein [Alphaproteobacteria bacterium]